MVHILKEKIKPVVRKMILESWEVKAGEKVLIISDFPSSEDFLSQPSIVLESILERNILAKQLTEIISELIPNPVELYFIKPTFEHYVDPDDSLFKTKIANSDIVLTLTEYSLTDVPTIKNLLNTRKIRHISAPLVTSEIFFPGGPMDVNFNELERITTKLYALINKAKFLEIYDLAGSHLRISLDSSISWILESSYVKEKGDFTNIPAGEVTLEITPDQRGCSISGNLNIFPGWQEDLTHTMTLSISDNRLIDVVGGGRVGETLQSFLNHENVRVTQFGIGTNPNAKDPLCATVADKFIGMAHIRLLPNKKIDHYYFPIYQVLIDGKEYSRRELFENDK